MLTTSRILLVIAVGGLAGCASTLTAVFERSVSDEELPPHIALTMTGERRIVVTGQPSPSGSGPAVVCAESSPDAARTIAAASKLEGKAPIFAGAKQAEASASFQDDLKTALTVTFTRTQAADIVRQLGWQNCLAYMNGAITAPQYQQNLDSIITKAFVVLGLPEPMAKGGP